MDAQVGSPAPLSAVEPAQGSVRQASASASAPAPDPVPLRLDPEARERALAETGGNRTAAAKLLEISHRALLYKMKEYGIR